MNPKYLTWHEIGHLAIGDLVIWHTIDREISYEIGPHVELIVGRTIDDMGLELLMWRAAKNHLWTARETQTFEDRVIKIS
jgi:hypothetical protein